MKQLLIKIKLIVNNLIIKTKIMIIFNLDLQQDLETLKIFNNLNSPKLNIFQAKH